MERREDGRPRAAAPQEPGTSPSWEQFVRESLVQAAWPVALAPPPRRALTVDHQFLPPGSYLDVSGADVKDLAIWVKYLTRYRDIYKQYFRWTSYYKYHLNKKFARDICEFCKMLNDDELVGKQTIYEDFRSWWDKNYTFNCDRNSTTEEGPQ